MDLRLGLESGMEQPRFRHVWQPQQLPAGPVFASQAQMLGRVTPRRQSESSRGRARERWEMAR
jgi:hypothetical protein